VYILLTINILIPILFLPIDLFTMDSPRPAPLLSLYENPSPMRLNGEEQIEDNREAERRYNEKKFRERQIPWGWLALNAVMIGLIFGLREPQKRFQYWKNKISPLLWPETSQTKALKQLELLEKRGLERALRDSKDEAKGARLYAEATDLMRSILEERYQLKAIHQTTQEFLQELAGSPDIDLEMRSLIENFLQHADLVKFANGTVTKQDYDQLLFSARQLILNKES
jgi:hypothetical protein